MLTCDCRGAEHIVCTPCWRVNTSARGPLAAEHAKMTKLMTLGQAVEAGLVIRPADPRWLERDRLNAGKCPQCEQKGNLAGPGEWIVVEPVVGTAPGDHVRHQEFKPSLTYGCLTCFVKRLRAEPAPVKVTS